MQVTGRHIAIVAGLLAAAGVTAWLLIPASVPVETAAVTKGRFAASVDEDGKLITWFKGRQSQTNTWAPEEISGHYIDGKSSADNTPEVSERYVETMRLITRETDRTLIESFLIEHPIAGRECEMVTILMEFKRFKKLQEVTSTHGSPRNCGSADRFYGRSFKPHYVLNMDRPGMKEIAQAEMTPEQIEDYRAGWNEQEDEKDWD